MPQSPMISVPLKATSEVDWIEPLKNYIRESYGDDPERYAEECATLNRLRQDMRGAGKESTSGRDMLYKYYGQLELLDLRFPVDEQHIKVAFSWFDAFTHKPTTQYSLAFEKASVIFNISAILSCYAAFQNRGEKLPLKVAYHYFQASAGMFTYINKNFLHMPSFDLSRETVKTLIVIMLAQAQEVFVEKQVADQKNAALLAKLAAQAGYLYGQAIEGVQDNVNRAIFEKVWLTMIRIKTNLLNSMAQHYQGLADEESGQHGVAISRFQVAESLAKEAERLSRNFPASVPANSNLSADCGSVLQEFSKRQLSKVQDRIREAVKDNEFIYHQTVPAEASLPAISKLPASKPISVSELYVGQDMQRITGPDLFAKIVPLAVTESASLYDEEKAKLVRAETERVDMANGELAASLDYLRLPGTLQVLQGGFDQDIIPDEDFRQWCSDVADHESPAKIFEFLQKEKDAIVSVLDSSSKQLDMEESVCEKMRSKYEGDWSQQPSSRLTSTLRSDIRNYRGALGDAQKSDNQLATKLQRNEKEFDEMRRAAREGGVDKLFHQAVAEARSKGTNAVSPATVEPNPLDTDFGESGTSVMDQVRKVEDILKKLNLIKRERNQVLKDLKEKVHNDDITQVLILSKKSIPSHESQMFEQELEKFRPHQNRLVQASHKQIQLMKELTASFNALLQDKRVRAGQSKYQSIQRQRSTVTNKYERAYQEFLDLEAGLQSAKIWYSEMRESVGGLNKNVESFVNNRRAEGAQLLKQFEQERSANKNTQAELERERLRGLAERMSVDPGARSTPQPSGRPTAAPLFQSGQGPRYPQTNFQGQYQVPTSPPPGQASDPGYSSPPPPSTFPQPTYNPSQFARNPGPTSPPPSQTSFSGSNMTRPQAPLPSSYGQVPQAQHQPQQAYGKYSLTHYSQNQPGTGFAPPGFVPPPPPPGPPPLGPQQTFHYATQCHDGGPLGQADGAQPRPAQGQQQRQQPHDPWSRSSAWK